MYIAQHNRSEKKTTIWPGGNPTMGTIARSHRKIHTNAEIPLARIQHILLLAGSDGVRKTNTGHELLYKRMENKFEINKNQSKMTQFQIKF
jgi:hypothetical protein